MKIFITNNWLCYAEWISAANLIKYFKENNCVIVKNPKKADCIILITCTWHKSREDECFRLIERLKKYKGELIVLGCLPGFAFTKFHQEFEGRYLLPKDYNKIDGFFKSFKVRFSDIPEAHSFPVKFLSLSKKISIVLTFLIYKTSKFKFIFKKGFIQGLQLFFKREQPVVYFRIASGCRNACTFCTANKAIGYLKSKSIEACLKEYKNLTQQGFRNFIIVAQDTGSYGLDIGSSLPELLEKMSIIDQNIDVCWILEGMNPKWIIRYKIDLLKYIKSGKIKLIVSPIQSGSDRILKLMNRNYEIYDALQCLKEFKDTRSDLILKTHIIVGFPSETKDDFIATLNTIKEAKFNHAYIHPYCDREGSYSSNFDKKIDEKKIAQRVKTAKVFIFKMKIKNLFS